MMVAPREPYHCACFLAHVEWSEGVISHAAGDVRVVAALNRYGATRSGSRLAGAGGAWPGLPVTRPGRRIVLAGPAGLQMRRGATEKGDHQATRVIRRMPAEGGRKRSAGRP
jgi:hypothetical protein